MNNIDIQAIEARAHRATRGPWSQADIIGSNLLANVTADFSDPDFVIGIAHNLHPRDAEFIAHARTDIPKLIARIRELETNQ